MSDLETLLSASVDLTLMRKTCARANDALEQAQDRIADLQGENARLRMQLLARDLIIDALKEREALPALLRRQAE